MFKNVMNQHNELVFSHQLEGKTSCYKESQFGFTTWKQWNLVVLMNECL